LQANCFITNGYTQQNKSKMNTISISYTLVWCLNFAENYQFTKCGKCFNKKTGKRLKQVYNSGCIGYNIKGRFYSLKYLRKKLIKIKEYDCPF